jgi:Mn2+/Fe2+ NRAMP family transporter
LSGQAVKVCTVPERHPAHLLAGLSDDDPAGIATYSILGAKYGYELLWVLALGVLTAL